MTIVRIALDVPVDTLFDYRADDAGSDDIGCRVMVPFGRRQAIGVIIEVADSTAVPASRLRPVTRLLRGEPAFGPPDLQLLSFAAAYYHHPLGRVILNALPKRLRRAQFSPPPPGHFGITATGLRCESSALPARALVQRRLFDAFKRHGSLDTAAIGTIAANARPALKRLMALGWIAPCAAPALQPGPPSARPALRPEQAAAVQAVVASFGRFEPFLLHGITGSGKTEVYLHAIDAALAGDAQVLLLVPEIALTPQLEAALRERFPGTHLASLHSGLNENERLTHWLAAHSGSAGIVLGTRLAVFTPLPRLGLVVVDEEHDASFKQMDGLRYSARDLAVVRAQQRAVPIVLGSATPALETHYNAFSGRYRLLELPNRIHAAPPAISCIDTRAHRPVDGLSPPLLAAIETRLHRGEQSLLFINRRGYAPVLLCGACGWLSGCRRCSAKLVLHLRERRLRCHHCGAEAITPAACPDCGNPDLRGVGEGTQRVEAALAARFPGARIARVDRDSTRRRESWQAMREQIHARQIDILVGTQILAKGHDFPHLNLVGVVNADSLLYSTDFRAPERLYAVLAQVAGRAGRSTQRGEVLIQTDFPQHPLFAALCAHDYSAFAQRELDARREAGFPPFVHQALLRAEASELAPALAFLTEAAAVGRTLGGTVTLYDPVPAAMMRRAGRERAQLLVQSANRAALQRFLAAWHAQLAAVPVRRTRWSLDVDPLEF